VKRRTVCIRCFTDDSSEYADDRALVAVDVIRATTTALTAIWMGRECHLVPTLQAAFDTASRLPNALLTGELGGEMPAGFELTNSPAQLAVRWDVTRPLVLLSSSGTRLMCGISRNDAAYLACFRNYSATIEHLVNNHDAVTLIGAGTHGDFREEDQMCCAWIADGLMQSGFAPEDDITLRVAERWRGAPHDAFLMSQSVAYLRKSGQLRDLDFILNHFDDVHIPGRVSANGDTTFAVATGCNR
jgi:2-phosphosulfolactate phosphatase